jgi:DNA-binding winged helix-turn-helix (wHTH) protein/tetratricopeptide (TPR) repeat protein
MKGNDLPSSRLRLGQLIIDVSDGQVINANNVFQLNKKAEQLLVLLARSANKVVLRDYILETVWAGRVVEDAAITNCIWQIRKALGDDAKEILQTSAKRGYMLAVPDDAWLIESSDATASGMDDNQNQNSLRSSLLRLRGIFRPYPVAALSAVFLSIVFFGLMRLSDVSVSKNGPDKAIIIEADDEISVTINVNPKQEWLRLAILPIFLEIAHSQSAEIVLFQSKQRRNPFAAPHAQIDVLSVNGGELLAEMSLTYRDRLRKERFKGDPNDFPSAVRNFLKKQLALSARTMSPVEEIVLSGEMAEKLYDRPKAVSAYRRAIAQDPRHADALLAMASLFYEQGLSRQALDLISGLEKRQDLSAHQRCRLQALIAKAAIERLGDDVCAIAADIGVVSRFDLRETLRRSQAVPVQNKQPSRWFEDEINAIEAHIVLHEYDRAEARIARNERLAKDSGWDIAAVGFDAQRALVRVYQNRHRDAGEIYQRVADAYDARGSAELADYHRIYALRTQLLLPGPSMTEMRAVLQAAVDRSRNLGNVSNELEGLQMLVRLDRGIPERWNHAMRRMRVLIEGFLSPESQAEQAMYLIDEISSQLRYSEVLTALDKASSGAASNAQIRMWQLMLTAEAHFARDEIKAAINAIDRMEKESFDIEVTGSTCLFSWLFAEARDAGRSRLFLNGCKKAQYDRRTKASNADYGYLAEARLHAADGQPERAWPVLRERIDALLATPEMSLEEAQSLSLLAERAAGLPGADQQRLKRALEATDAMAKRDGSGPRLRLGVHILRWRLCVQSKRNDCGPVLPEWAAENFLRARLAQEQSSRE